MLDLKMMELFLRRPGIAEAARTSRTHIPLDAELLEMVFLNS